MKEDLKKLRLFILNAEPELYTDGELLDVTLQKLKEIINKY